MTQTSADLGAKGERRTSGGPDHELEGRSEGQGRVDPPRAGGKGYLGRRASGGPDHRGLEAPREGRAVGQAFADQTGDLASDNEAEDQPARTGLESRKADGDAEGRAGGAAGGEELAFERRRTSDNPIQTAKAPAKVAGEGDVEGGPGEGPRAGSWRVGRRRQQAKRRQRRDRPSEKDGSFQI